MLIKPGNSVVMVTVVGTAAQIRAAQSSSGVTVVMSPAEAAEYLGVTRARIHQLVQEGKLEPFGATDRGYFYRLNDLDVVKPLLRFKRIE